ncbi:MAG: TatD family hydrolase, partial [Defluviitoga tunisiensis]
NDKIVGIGATGLDLYWETNTQTQYKVFDAQVSIAKKLNKPLVLHIRDAYNDAYEFLKKSSLPSKLGVVHCFSDTWETAKKFLDLGFYLGFDGPITYPKNTELRKVVQQTPLERILPETDSPFLPPVPFRGKRNMPIYVKYVYEKIAEIKKIDIEELKSKLYFNTMSLFF